MDPTIGRLRDKIGGNFIKAVGDEDSLNDFLEYLNICIDAEYRNSVLHHDMCPWGVILRRTILSKSVIGRKRP